MTVTKNDINHCVRNDYLVVAGIIRKVLKITDDTEVELFLNEIKERLKGTLAMLETFNQGK